MPRSMPVTAPAGERSHAPEALVVERTFVGIGMWIPSDRRGRGRDPALRRDAQQVERVVDATRCTRRRHRRRPSGVVPGRSAISSARPSTTFESRVSASRGTAPRRRGSTHMPFVKCSGRGRAPPVAAAGQVRGSCGRSGRPGLGARSRRSRANRPARTPASWASRAAPPPAGRTRSSRRRRIDRAGSPACHRVAQVDHARPRRGRFPARTPPVLAISAPCPAAVDAVTPGRPCPRRTARRRGAGCDALGMVERGCDHMRSASEPSMRRPFDDGRQRRTLSAACSNSSSTSRLSSTPARPSPGSASSPSTSTSSSVTSSRRSRDSATCWGTYSKRACAE